MPTFEVRSPDDPRLRDYANLTDAQLRDADWTGARGVFIAEGELVVRRLLESRFAVRSLLVTRTGLERLAGAPLSDGTPVYVVDQALMGAVVGFPFHRGILACGERPGAVPLAEVLGSARTLVVLEDLSNADNVGAVFRNAGALGGTGTAVLLSPGCCDPLYRKSLRVSMGQALRVPFGRAAPWPAALEQVAAAGFEVVGLTPESGAVDLARYQRPRGGGRLALLLGAEGPGLTEAAFRHCQVKVRIPMDPGADSLNVATALAVALSALR